MGDTSPRDAANAKILKRFKRLEEHLEPGELALRNQPAIWESEQSGRGQACDVILTNRRLLGYYQVRIPRERLFLEALSLQAISTVTLRERSHDPLFRELLISAGEQRVSIRGPIKPLEALYAALRHAIEEAREQGTATELAAESEGARPATLYGRQALGGSFERSPLGIALLFAVGLLLEILAAFLWIAGNDLSTSLPPFIAGVVATLTAILVYRQQRRGGFDSDRR